MIFRKILTDQRPTLKQSTLFSLMSIKFNSYQCCHDSTFSKELLTNCKKATVVHKINFCNYHTMRMDVAGVWFINLGVARGCGFMVPETISKKLRPMTSVTYKPQVINYV